MSKVQTIKNKPNKEDLEEITKEKVSNPFLFWLMAFLVATLIMILIFCASFYFVIHNNLNGLAEKYRPQISSIPLMNLALPKVPEQTDPKLMTEAQLRTKYTENTNKISELTKQLDAANKKIAELQKVKDQVDKITTESQNALKAAHAQKVSQDAEKKKLETLKQKVNEMIANGDQQGFAAYYQQIDSASAQKIYADIIKSQQSSTNAQKFAQIYQTMDPASAAKIFEQLGNAKIDLVVETLKNMKKEISSQILANMSPAYASKVTEKLRKALK